MAAKKRGAASGVPETGSSSRTARNTRGRSRRRRTARGVQSTSGELRGRVAGGYKTSRRGARRLLAEARDIARSVGETTFDGARGLAAGAGGAAASVASRTRDTAVQVAGKVRENPWPALLIGAGATWMVIDATRDRPDVKSGRQTRGRGSRRSAGQIATAALSTVADAGRDIGGRVEQFVRDNPLVAGAATLGVGVAVGLALPATSQENTLLGNARESVMKGAKQAARGTVSTVAESARRLSGR